MLRDLYLAMRGGEMQSAPSPASLKSEPINPAWIKEGTPEARAMFLTMSGDSMIRSGIWECTEGKFDWIFAFDEIVQILEGEVHVEAEGQVRILRAGSTAYFPFGLKTHWHVPKYVKKFFTHHYPSRTKQLARRLGSVIRRGIRLSALTLAASGVNETLALTAASL